MQSEQNGMQQELDLREILHILSVRWWIVAVFFIISVTITGIVTFKMIDPVYRAETSLFVGKESDKIASLDLGEFNLNKSLVTDYRQIILSRLVSKEVISEIGLDMTVDDFQKKVDVTTIQDSRLFKISFESTDPKLAMDVANALARVIIEKAKDIIEVKNVQVVDTAELPEKPVKPSKAQNMAIAGILGIMVGIGVVLLIEYMDYTIKNAKDVEKHLGLVTIGEIPLFAGEKRNTKKRSTSSGKSARRKEAAHDGASPNVHLSPSLISVLDPKAPASEAYRSLRTNIGYSGVDKQMQLIMLTSPGPAEGKSTTSANIAVGLAQSGKKVLIMDCDLRKPRIHKYFSLPNDVGVTDIIIKNCPYNSAIKTTDTVSNLSIMCSGSIPPNPTEILESQKMAGLITSLRDDFDLIIIDTPPIGQLADGAIIAGYSDGVILVVASGESNIDMAVHAKEALEHVNAKVIGTVLTKISKSTSGSYYHYYNYDKYYEASE